MKKSISDYHQNFTTEQALLIDFKYAKIFAISFLFVSKIYGKHWFLHYFQQCTFSNFFLLLFTVLKEYIFFISHHSKNIKKRTEQIFNSVHFFENFCQFTRKSLKLSIIKDELVSVFITRKLMQWTTCCKNFRELGGLLTVKRVIEKSKKCHKCVQSQRKG